MDTKGEREVQKQQRLEYLETLNLLHEKLDHSAFRIRLAAQHKMFRLSETQQWQWHSSGECG